METQISTLFHVRKDKKTTDNLFPIYLRVTIDGKRFEYSTQRFISWEKWSPGMGKAKGKSEEVKNINDYLDVLVHKVFIYQKELSLEGKPINIETFKNKWLGIIEDQKMILEVFQQHNDKVAELVGKDFADGTLERYVTSLEHTRRFIQWKYKVNDLDVNQLNYEFITEYEFWLKSVRNCAHNTTMKYLANFKKIVLICVKNGWLQKDPFFGYKLSKKVVIREFLSEKELQVMAEKQFASKRLEQVRDIFLFCCYTGLAYADIYKLKRSEIRPGIDGKKWIFTSRQKTDTLSHIPLLPVSLTILDKYAQHAECLTTGRLLPVLSNQKMNSYLKEITDVCGISKELTFHIARHTFATTVTLNNGVPIETVSKMLGHTNLRTTQHYAKLLDTKISHDMQRLSEKLEIQTEMQDTKVS
jgi:site-specific recombinase XerD